MNEGCMIHHPGTESVEVDQPKTFCPTCDGETKRVTSGVGPHYGECGAGHVYLLTEAKHKRDEPNEWPDQGQPEKAPRNGSWIIAAFQGEEAGTCVIETVRHVSTKAEMGPHHIGYLAYWVTAGGTNYGDDILIAWWPCPIVRMPKDV